MTDLKAPRGSDQYPLRFPKGMRSKIKKAAAESGRTMNAEIIYRLEYYQEVMEATTARTATGAMSGLEQGSGAVVRKAARRPFWRGLIGGNA